MFNTSLVKYYAEYFMSAQFGNLVIYSFVSRKYVRAIKGVTTRIIFYYMFCQIT